MALAPMMVRYCTNNGEYYVYDVCSAEIFHVSDVIYRILPDYHILTDDEIVEKHREMSEQSLRNAISQLDEMQSRNFLCDHHPERTVRAEAVRCDGKIEPVEEFIANHRRLLTLELTHQCNLACVYCAFGEYYDQKRNSDVESMSFDTAKQAVAHFLSHKPKEAGIGFYGGEPLLEFDLIKKIVLYAESFAQVNDMDIRFSMTTNGTLLTDERIHFLVQHNFSVMVSLDGDKESHDRYRVFKNNTSHEPKKCSFDVIIKNMERFVELYPDYPGRGIILTLTATSNFASCEKFIALWKPTFPTVIANFVTPVRLDERDCVDGEGCWQGSSCGDGFCGRNYRRDHLANNNIKASQELLKEPPTFARWSDESSKNFHSWRSHFLSTLCSLSDMDMTKLLRENFSINKGLLDAHIRDVHKRKLQGFARVKSPVTRMSCFPGATRTYCSSKGILYTCEKTEFDHLLALGNVESDVDAHKAYDLAEMLRLFCDCANCIANSFCGLCPAQVTVSKDNPERLDGFAIRKKCQELADESNLARRLKEYAEIMSANPNVLE
jgi:sulfatase maturation enzyme AslB (radical SAM superfamily)